MSIFSEIQNKNAQRGNLILKAFGEGETLEKSKKGDIGEIREWGGKKYKKGKDGWELVKEGGEGKKETQEEGKKEDNFREISFKDKKETLLKVIESKIKFISNYKVDDSENRLLIKNKHKDSFIDIMPAERVLGGDDIKGKLWIQFYDKSEVKSTSLADSKAAYLTTSARIVKHKKTDVRKEVSSFSEFEKMVDNFILKTQ